MAALALLRDTGGKRARGGFDLVGSLSITGAMLLLVYGVVRLEHPDNGLLLTVATFVTGLALLRLFVAIERRSSSPLVPLGILRKASLVRVNVAALLFLVAFGGIVLAAVAYAAESGTRRETLSGRRPVRHLGGSRRGHGPPNATSRSYRSVDRPVALAMFQVCTAASAMCRPIAAVAGISPPG